MEGDMNESGYYLASFGGKSGLVPANFIQEAEVTDLAMRERLFNQVIKLLYTHKQKIDIVNCLLFSVAISQLEYWQLSIFSI